MLTLRGKRYGVLPGVRVSRKRYGTCPRISCVACIWPSNSCWQRRCGCRSAPRAGTPARAAAPPAGPRAAAEAAVGDAGPAEAALTREAVDRWLDPEGRLREHRACRTGRSGPCPTTTACGPPTPARRPKPRTAGRCTASPGGRRPSPSAARRSSCSTGTASAPSSRPRWATSSAGAAGGQRLRPAPVRRPGAGAGPGGLRRRRPARHPLRPAPARVLGGPRGRPRPGRSERTDIGSRALFLRRGAGAPVAEPCGEGGAPRAVGTRKLVYGSDIPVVCATYQIRRVLLAPIPEEDQRRILGGTRSALLATRR